MTYLSRGVCARRSRRIGIRSGALVVALAAAHAARAEAVPVELHWDAPRDCPGAGVVMSRIAQRLHDVGSRPHLRVDARITRPNSSTYHLWLVLDAGSQHTERSLRARRCDDLADTAAWLIALAAQSDAPVSDVASTSDAAGNAEAAQTLRPSGRSAPPAAAGGSAGAQALEPRAEASSPAPAGAPKDARGPEAEQRTPTALQPAPATPPEAPAPVRPRKPIPAHYLLGASSGVFSGAGADVQAVVGAFAAVGLAWSHTRLGAAGLLPRELDVRQGVRAQVWSLELALSECALWGERVQAGPCITLAGLRTGAEVHGVTRGTQRAGLWASGRAGLALLWRVHPRVSLTFGAEAGLALSRRPRFLVTGLGPAAAVRTWSVDGRLGLSFRGP